MVRRNVAYRGCGIFAHSGHTVVMKNPSTQHERLCVIFVCRPFVAAYLYTCIHISLPSRRCRSETKQKETYLKDTGHKLYMVSFLHCSACIYYFFCPTTGFRIYMFQSDMNRIVQTVEYSLIPHAGSLLWTTNIPLSVDACNRSFVVMRRARV